jgi:hypothetical protein
MHFAFDSQPLRELCESAERASNALGPDVAAVLRARLADIQAALNIGDILFNKEFFTRDDKDLVKIHLIHGFYLVLSPNSHDLKSFKGSRPDWSRVVRVKILGVEACNDGDT